MRVYRAQGWVLLGTNVYICFVDFICLFLNSLDIDVSVCVIYLYCTITSTVILIGAMLLGGFQYNSKLNYCAKILDRL